MTQCERLEEYLIGDLKKYEAVQFTAHLDKCSPCRVAVDEQLWIDELLHKNAAAQKAPADITDQIEQTIIRKNRHRRLAKSFGAITAAASLAIAFLLQHTKQKTLDTQTATVSPTSIATFIGTDDIIVVQHDSPYPDVTIVEIYPTFRAHKRSQNQYSQPSLTSPTHIPGDPS